MLDGIYNWESMLRVEWYAVLRLSVPMPKSNAKIQITKRSSLGNAPVRAVPQSPFC